MGSSVLSQLIISRTSPPHRPGEGRTMAAGSGTPPLLVGRQDPFSPTKSKHQTLWFIMPLGGLQPARAGPSDAIVVLDVGTLVQNHLLHKTGRCTGWWAGGEHRGHLSQSWKPRHCPLGRQRLTGLMEMTYSNMTIGRANLQWLIFIPITAAGILIC